MKQTKKKPPTSQLWSGVSEGSVFIHTNPVYFIWQICVTFSFIYYFGSPTNQKKTVWLMFMGEDATAVPLFLPGWLMVKPDVFWYPTWSVCVCVHCIAGIWPLWRHVHVSITPGVSEGLREVCLFWPITMTTFGMADASEALAASFFSKQFENEAFS